MALLVIIETQTLEKTTVKSIEYFQPIKINIV